MKRYSIRVDHKGSSPTHAQCAMVEDAYKTGYDDKVLFNIQPRGKWYAEFVVDSLKEIRFADKMRRKAAKGGNDDPVGSGDRAQAENHNRHRRRRPDTD